MLVAVVRCLNCITHCIHAHSDLFHHTDIFKHAPLHKSPCHCPRCVHCYPCSCSPNPYQDKTCFTASSMASSSLRMRHKQPSSSSSELSCNLNAACPPPFGPSRIKTFRSPAVTEGIRPVHGYLMRKHRIPTFKWRLVCRENSKPPGEPEALQAAHDRIESPVAPSSCGECRRCVPHIREVVILLALFRCSYLT